MSMKWIKVVIHERELNVGFDENSIHVYNAFPIKDDLKLRGYRWEPGDKSWFIAPVNLEKELNALKNNLCPPAEAPIPAGPDEVSRFPHSFSVIELRNRIDQLIKEGIRGNIWIRGVVASEIKHYQWASYFDLKDERERSDVFFRVEVKKNHLLQINLNLKETGVADRLEKDLPVFCLVEVHLSLRNVVDVRLNLRDILPEFTQAKIRNQRDITLEKLRFEGILENQKNLTLPVLVSRIGLITSEQGTSVRDIMAGLGPFKNHYDFTFLDTRMEGATAVESLLNALDVMVNRIGIELDMIVIARGGGSEQSLSVFNDYRLCQRICTAKIPVITAIGHEKDLSAAEVCSHLTPAPSTPSGVGKYLQERFFGLQTTLVEMINRLIQFFLMAHSLEIEKLTALLQVIPGQISQLHKFKKEGFLYLLRQFEHSARFVVREQEKSISNILPGIFHKNQLIHDRARFSIDQKADFILSRMRFQNQQAAKQAGQTMEKLDFKKRRRESRKSISEVIDMTGRIFNRCEKLIQGKDQRLSTLHNLALASDPGQILKKGFTLALDDQNRVISTLKRFETLKRARLRFQDGISEILRKEEK